MYKNELKFLKVRFGLEFLTRFDRKKLYKNSRFGLVEILLLGF